MSALELTSDQAAALAHIDDGIKQIGAGFDEFVAGAAEAERAGVPAVIIQAKAGELQQTVMGKMLQAS